MATAVAAKNTYSPQEVYRKAARHPDNCKHFPVEFMGSVTYPLFLITFFVQRRW